MERLHDVSTIPWSLVMTRLTCDPKGSASMPSMSAPMLVSSERAAVSILGESSAFRCEAVSSSLKYKVITCGRRSAGNHSQSSVRLTRSSFGVSSS